MKIIYKNSLRVLFMLLIGLLSACAVGSRPGLDKPAAPNLLSQESEEDETEYELIIIDQGYQSWALTNKKPVSYYSPSYYENRNQQYVVAWNEKVNQQAYYNSATYPFENRIEYNPAVDYGLELNYELFWYFRYIQALYGPVYNFPGFSMR